jgi:hypothetical protein
MVSIFQKKKHFSELDEISGRVEKHILQVADLVDEKISAVSFVQDYAELHFDGPVLRSIANPKIITPTTATIFPEKGSRELLCELINQTVRSIKLVEGKSFSLITRDKYTLVIPLDAQHSRGHENMHFIPAYGEPIQVW